MTSMPTQTKNAALISQILLDCSPQSIANEISSLRINYISLSPSHSDYSPSKPLAQAPTNVPLLASRQPPARADCSSALATLPIHAEIPQHRLHYQPLDDCPPPQMVAQATLTPAATARDRKGKRLRGMAGCFGLLGLSAFCGGGGGRIR